MLTVPPFAILSFPCTKDVIAVDGKIDDPVNRIFVELLFQC